MADKQKNVVLNFKMDGQVQYAETLREINSVMNTAAKEYKNYVAAMGDDAKATDKLRAEKKKLEIQMEGAQKRTQMLRTQYEAMSKSTKTTTGQLTQMYSKLLDAERAETSLQNAMDKVNEGLSDQAQETREAQDALTKLKDESQLLEAEQKRLTSTFNLQNAELGENAEEIEKVELAQKQLDSQMDLSRRTILNLEQQLDQAKKAYGENSTEVMKMEARLNDAITTFSKFKKSVGEVEVETKKAKKSIKGLGSGMQGLAGALPAAGVGGFVQGMQEYNEVLARLRTNASTSGRDLSVVEDAFTRITAITGEADAAGETLANLLASGFDDNQLAAVIDQVNGAYIRFSDTLKTEGIADGIQETLAAGEAVGPFAELLERSGIKLEDFNKKLADSKTKGEDANLVLQTLSEQGFGDMYAKYQELNPEVQKNAEANAEMQKSLAELALVLTPLVTQVSDFTIKIIEWATENPTLTTTIVAGTVAIGGLVAVLTAAIPIVAALIPLTGSMGVAVTAATWPILAIIAAIAAAIAIGVLLYKNWDTIREKAGSLMEKLGPFKPMVLALLGPFGALIGAGVTLYKNWDTIREKSGQLLNKLGPFKGIFLSLTSPIGSLIAIGVKLYKNWDTIQERAGKLKTKVANLFKGIKWELPKVKLPKFSISGDFSLNPPSVPKLSVKWNAKGAIFTEPTIAGLNRGTLQGFGEAGPEAALPLNDETLGAIGRGIDATRSKSDTRPIILQVDGKTFARITGDYTDAEGGTRIRHIQRGLA